MNREVSPKVSFSVIPEKRRDKFAVLKKAIREGTYKVKSEDIAEKILKEWLFELVLTLYNLNIKSVGTTNLSPGREIQ